MRSNAAPVRSVQDGENTTTTTSTTTVVLILLLFLACCWIVPTIFAVVSQSIWLPNRYSETGVVQTQERQLQAVGDILDLLWLELFVINATHRDTNVTNVTSCIACNGANDTLLPVIVNTVLISGDDVEAQQVQVYDNSSDTMVSLLDLVDDVTLAVAQLQSDVDDFQCNCTGGLMIFVDRGNWTNGTTYTARDYVFHNGSYWLLVASSASDNSTQPGTDDSVWSYYGIEGPPGPPGGVGPPGPPGQNGTSYPNGTAGAAGDLGLIPTTPWINGTAYNDTQVATYLGQSYMAIVNGTTNDPTDGTQWTLYVWKGSPGGPGGLGPQGSPGDLLEPSTAWNSTAAYVLGNVVTYLGGAYVASQPNTNTTPGSNTTAWASVGTLGPAGPPGGPGGNGTGACAVLLQDYVQPAPNVPVQVVVDFLNVQEGQAAVVVDAGYYMVASGSIIDFGNGTWTYNLTYGNATGDIFIAQGGTVNASRCIYPTSYPLPGATGSTGTAGTAGVVVVNGTAAYLFATICQQDRRAGSSILGGAPNIVSFSVLDQRNSNGTFTSVSFDGWSGVSSNVTLTTSTGAYSTGLEKWVNCSTGTGTSTGLVGRCCAVPSYRPSSISLDGALNINNPNAVSRLTLTVGLWRLQSTLQVRRCVAESVTLPGKVQLEAVGSTMPPLTYWVQYTLAGPDTDPEDVGQLHNYLLDTWISLPVAQTFQLTVTMSETANPPCDRTDLTYVQMGYISAMQYGIATAYTT